MILKDSIINCGKTMEAKLKEFLCDNYTIQQFHSKAYNRDYDVYMCQSNEKTIVIKKINDMDEVLSYRLLKGLNDKNTPQIYLIEEVDEDHWMFMEYLEPVERDIIKSDIQELAVRLADIHGSVVLKEPPTSHLRTWRFLNTRREDLEILVDSEITDGHIDTILKSQAILRKCFRTFIHGDMIPLNMIVGENGVRIIDWEYGHIGPYILDLGRLLADFNVDRPWIDPNWEEDILRSYFQEISKYDPCLTYEQMYLDYHCARLENYLGIIRAFKIKKWPRTDWYDLNLNQMMQAIQTIDKLTLENHKFSQWNQLEKITV